MICNLDETNRYILTLLRRKNVVSIADIMHETGLASAQIKNRINNMIKVGIVRESGFLIAKRNGKSSQAYCLTDEGIKFCTQLRLDKPIAIQVLKHLKPRIDEYGKYTPHSLSYNQNHATFARQIQY